MKENVKDPLLVLGDFAWDVLIRTNTELLPGGDVFGEVMLAPGGSAANVAVWAARCGMKTRFIGKIGRDYFGHLAIQELERENVDAHLIRTDEHRTASVAVWISYDGQRSMVSGQGADFYLLPSELPAQLLRNTRHLHLTAWSFFTNPPRAAARRAAALAKAAGATLSFDPGSFQMIEQIGAASFLEQITDLKLDLIFPNLEEGRVLTGRKSPREIIARLADLFPDTVIALKLDAKGAIIFHREQHCNIPPGSDTLLDATGAGDSFAGAFLSRYLAGENMETAGRFAVKIASWVINRVGARPKGDLMLQKLLNSQK